MSTDYVAELEEIEFPTPAAEGTALLRVGAADLRPGWYVAALDRPWTDTPFPSTGLYLENTEQVEALQEHCDSALIDPLLSAPEGESALRAAARALEESGAGDTAIWPDTATPTPAAPAAPRRGTVQASEFARSARPRNDVRVSRAWRLRLRRLMIANDRGAGLSLHDYGLLDRARSWIAGAGRAMMPGAGSLAGLRTIYGEAVGSTTHRQTSSMLVEMPAARLAFQGLLHAGEAASLAVQEHQVLPWSALSAAIECLVDSVIRHPDAALWCDRMHEQRGLGDRQPTTPAILMARFARHLGLPREDLVRFAAIGFSADLGKLRLPKELLEHPGQLSADAFETVKGHVRESVSLLEAAAGVPPEVIRGVAEHHERANGSGYPGRLKGHAIGLGGACAAIVDCYTALISARAYANPMAPEDALAALLSWSKSLFDPALAEQFALATGLFPVGSAVELVGGGVGVVVDQPNDRPAASRVLVLTGPDGRPLAPRDRAAPAPRQERVRIARGLPVGAYGVRLPDYYFRGDHPRIG